jgi:3-oxoacyl-[acyl-carrier protein] reductase
MQDQQLFNLQERIAVVTGASGGFGAESPRALARAGAKVVLIGRDRTRLHPLAEELGDRVAVVEGDVSKKDEADRLVEAVAADHGSLDILVNAAGGATVGRLMDLGDETWQADIDLKLLGYLRMMCAAAKVMQGQGSGRIINVVGLA